MEDGASGSTYNVTVKWGKEVYKEVPLNTSESVETFRMQLFSLTNVPPDRQKIMGFKGGPLKDTADLSKVGAKNGMRIMLIGTAGELMKQPDPSEAPAEAQPDEPKAEASYPVGLVNLGNTCYMNSTLQALRSVPELLEALKGFTANGVDQDRKLAGSMRDLFVALSASKQPLPPFQFMSHFHAAFPQFAEKGEHGGLMQQDAEEAYSQMMTSLSRALKSQVTALFEGDVDVTSKCVESDDASEVEHTVTTFQKLNCHISKDTNFLLDGLKQGLSEHITKRSPTLGREAVYEKSQRISRLPYNLSVQFVRFFWKADVKTKAKILRPVQFPLTLDMYDLCTTELQRKLKAVRNKEKLAEDVRLGLATAPESGAAEGGDSAAMDTTFTAEELLGEPLENTTGRYQLQAVVTHQGRTADGGHYVAWVRQGADLWAKFDDERVSYVRDSDVLALSGKGGGDWHIAYLALYRTIRPNFEGLDAPKATEAE